MQTNPVTWPMAGILVRALPRPAAMKPATAQSGGVYLQRDEVIRLDKNSQITRVQVASGRVWLTGSPAAGDVLLSTGDQFELRDHWPFVIQALGPARLFLCPDDLPANARARSRPALSHYVSMC